MSASDVTARVREALDPYVESGYMPGYVAGVSADGDTSVCAGGALATDSGAPMQPRTMFRIASLTKLLGGVLAMRLVADETLRLERL